MDMGNYGHRSVKITKNAEEQSIIDFHLPKTHKEKELRRAEIYNILNNQ